MLASYIGPKGPKNFCNILIWQIIRKLFLVNRFFLIQNDRSVILLNMISRYFSKLLTANSSDIFRTYLRKPILESLSALGYM